MSLVVENAIGRDTHSSPTSPLDRKAWKSHISERECEPLYCDMCPEHGYTFHEGCTYSADDDLDAGARVTNVHSYEACTSLCTNTAGCAAVTYYSKYYGSTNINSGVTSDLAADGSSGTGGMLCIMKKQTTGQRIMKKNL